MKFIKRVLIAFFAMLGCGLAAAGLDSGTMVKYEPLGGYDFKYATALNKSKASVASEVQYQAEFQWYGTYGTAVTEGHVILAATQIAATNRPYNASMQMLYSHGAGVFLSPRGLAIELWHRADTNSNGFNDDLQNAFYWDQDNNRCVLDVLGTIGSGVYCLGSTAGAGEYITPAPNFQLKKGLKYIVRFKLKPSVTFPGRTRLEAELYEPGPWGRVLVQKAATDFVTSEFLPTAQDLQATVARLPGSASDTYINFKIWDYWN